MNMSNTYYVVLGKVIQRERLRRKTSQSDLAIQCGIGQSHLSRVEAGTLHPPIHTVRRIATALGVSFVDIIEEAEAEMALLERISP